MLSRSPLPSDLAGPSTTVTTPQGRVYTRHPGGAHLVYTPMIHAKVFLRSKPEHRGGDAQFDLTRGEEGFDIPLAGIEGGDRPLFVQASRLDLEVQNTLADDLSSAPMIRRLCWRPQRK